MKVYISLLFILVSSFTFAEETVEYFYKKIEPEKKVFSLRNNEAEKVDALLVETDDIKNGTYEISVTDMGNHIYKIENTNLYIEMPYCFKYCYSQRAILNVKTYIGTKIGTLIWIDD